jgi:hypothetical protein
MKDEDLRKYRPKGRWWDLIEITKPDGNIEVVKTPMKNNVIVETAPKLLAGLMANEASFSGGILYHSLGEGQQSWEVSLPSPNYQSTWQNEVFRKVPESIQYIDGNGNPTTAITDIIRIKTVFEKEEANGFTIREQGIWGGDAQAVVGTGLAVNLIWHKGIPKDDSMKLTRYIEFLF